MENIRREVLAAYESEHRRLAKLYEEKTGRMLVLKEALRGNRVNDLSIGSATDTEERRSALRRFETLAQEIMNLEMSLDAYAARDQQLTRHADDIGLTAPTEPLLQVSQLRPRLEEATQELREIMGRELQAEHDGQEITGSAAQAVRLELKILEASTMCTARSLQNLSEKVDRWRFMPRQRLPRVGINNHSEQANDNNAQSIRSGPAEVSGIGPGFTHGCAGGPFEEPGMLVADSNVFLAAMEGNGHIAFDEPGVVVFSWTGRYRTPAARAPSELSTRN